ncbi:MAG TPA: YihY/virulence factor BrkB family protein [Fibrobacteria bacterium]|jgi:membrane protein|nr:YihY/virulence factor BrkB family protein [Fibrobacteria bacterium]
MKRFIRSLKEFVSRSDARLWTLLGRIHGAQRFLRLLAAAFREWTHDDASRLAASVAYYTIFSLAPLLVIAIAVAGFFFGETHARDEILAQMTDLLGRSGAAYLRTLLDTSWNPATGVLATAIGVVVLLLGATGAFAHLQEALNLMWEVEAPKRSGLWAYLRRRLISFSLVLTVGFLLLVSLVLSATLSAAGKFVGGVLPPYFPLLSLLSWAASFAVTTVLFAAIYKILPDAKVRWKNVWLGAILAALMFSLGRYLIGLYLGRSSLGSAYGAAGSFVIILLWIYYSAQILFFGAEFTQVSARFDREERERKVGGLRAPDKASSG